MMMHDGKWYAKHRLLLFPKIHHSLVWHLYWSDSTVSDAKRFCVSSGAFGGHAAGLPPLESHSLFLI